MSKHRSAKRIICYILAVLLFLAGAVVYAYPYVNRAVTSSNAEESLESFRFVRSAYNGAEDAPITDSSGNVEKTEAQLEAASLSDEERERYDATLLNDLREAMVQYNEKIYAEKQTGLKDAWSYTQSEFDLTEYGVTNNVVGELRIPAMDLDMPLYLGATQNNMAWGAAQLGQTSMPIGGENTNCVIAGHRGCTNGDYFLDIEVLKEGDRVYVDNLWETLTYEVTEIKIISPDDISEILIQDGKDMLTLITCHPYPYNYQRYAVFCERTYDDESAGDSDDISDAQTDTDSGAAAVDNSSEGFIELENILAYAVPIFLAVLTIVCIIIVRLSRSKRRKRK